MTAQQRLGLSLAVSLGIGGLLFVAADWWWRKPPAPMPVSTEADGGAGNERVEELRAAIESQQRALRDARQQRGAAVAELERLGDELEGIRERLKGLRERAERGEVGGE